MSGTFAQARTLPISLPPYSPRTSPLGRRFHRHQPMLQHHRPHRLRVRRATPCQQLTNLPKILRPQDPRRDCAKHHSRLMKRIHKSMHLAALNPHQIPRPNVDRLPLQRELQPPRSPHTPSHRTPHDGAEPASPPPAPPSSQTSSRPTRSQAHQSKTAAQSRPTESPPHPPHRPSNSSHTLFLWIHSRKKIASHSAPT